MTPLVTASQQRSTAFHPRIRGVAARSAGTRMRPRELPSDPRSAVCSDVFAMEELGIAKPSPVKVKAAIPISSAHVRASRVYPPVEKKYNDT
nr:hypothetical protein [uncultured Cellulomonas sp.]